MTIRWLTDCRGDLRIKNFCREPCSAGLNSHILYAQMNVNSFIRAKLYILFLLSCPQPLQSSKYAMQQNCNRSSVERQFLIRTKCLVAHSTESIIITTWYIQCPSQKARFFYHVALTTYELNPLIIQMAFLRSGSLPIRAVDSILSRNK